MVDILLATYQGEKFLSTQLDSILGQTFQDFTVYISDDGSTDNTKKIIGNFLEQYPTKIKVVQSSSGLSSAKSNFFFLLSQSTSDYAMFCDQDDFWEKDKIQVSLDKIQNLEKENGNNTPILVHTDLSVVDENLKLLHKSFFEYQNLDYKNTSLKGLMVQNSVTGCTVIINRSAKDLVRNTASDKIIMHDWWIALICSAFGIVDFLLTPTIKYRQHSNNEVGAKDAKSVEYLISKISKSDVAKQNFKNCLLQAEQFLQSIKKSYHLNKSRF